MESPQVVSRPARFGVRVNGEDREVRDGATLGELLRELGLGGRRVAVAVNRDVVPRRALEERTIAPGDAIEILEAVGGG
jgi:thiamine biosynthesis protein ThiS